MQFLDYSAKDNIFFFFSFCKHSCFLLEMKFSPYSVSQVCGMVSADRWVCSWSRVIHGFTYWKRLWEVVTRLQEIAFKELCIWASIVFISFFLLIRYLLPLAQTLSQDYIDISNINWENLAMTCLSWGGYPQEPWAASRNCGVLSVFYQLVPCDSCHGHHRLV